MAFTQQQLDALNTAIATGTAATIEYEGKRITYRSLDELVRMRDIVAAELNATSGVVKSRSSLCRFSKG